MPLVKFSLLKRRTGIDREAFSRHWSGRHVEVLLAAGHRSYNADYVQNHFFARPDEGLADERFDGAAQLVQRTDDPRAAAFQDDPRYLRNVRPDELNFLDVERSCAIFTRAVELRVTASPRAFKLMTFYRLRSDVALARDGEPDVEAMLQRRRRAGPRWPLLASHVEYFTARGGGRPFSAGGSALPAFDGVSEIAFADAGALERALDDPELRSLLRDPNWMEDGACSFLARAMLVYDDRQPRETPRANG